jgi:hypothetical protein
VKRPHIGKPLQLRFLYSTWGGAWLARAAAGRKAPEVHQGDDEVAFLRPMVPNLIWGIGHESRNRTQAGF